MIGRPHGAERERAGFDRHVRVIEVGIRELQRATSSFVGRVEEGLHLIVTRHGRPVAVVLPMASAHSWVLQNRPLPGPGPEAEARWLVAGVARIESTAREPWEQLPDATRGRLLGAMRRLRPLDARGRIVVRAGLVWAVLDLGGAGEAPLVRAVAGRAELQRWLWAGGLPSERAAVARARDGMPSREFQFED